MALAEFAAIEAAYRALTPLNQTARHRALAWLTSALGGSGNLPEDTGTSTGVMPATNGAKPATKPAPAKRARRATAPGVKATAAGSGKRGATASRQATARSAKGSSAKRTAKATTSTMSAERAYRRMPEVDEVLGAYRQVGTVSGLAEHFDVPRHTVQGWARRLRREGHTIGRS